MVRISNPNPNRTEHLQKNMTAWCKDKKEKKDCNIDFSKGSWDGGSCKAKLFFTKKWKDHQILHRGQNIQQRSLLQRITELQPYLLCPQHQYCHVQSKLLNFCFYLSILKRCKNTFLCHRWRYWEVLYSQHVSRE